GGIRKKRERQRVEERDVGDEELLPPRGLGVVVEPERDAEAGRRELREEREGPDPREKESRAAPSEIPDPRHQEDQEKEEDVRPEEEAAEEQSHDALCSTE